MNHHEMVRTDSFKKINVYGNENAADFPAASKGGELFAALKPVIVNIDKANADQASAKGDVRQDFLSKGTARENVRARCSSISKTSVGAAYEVPGLDVKFYLPVDLSDAELLAHAQMVLADAPEHEATLKLWGEEDDFLGELAEAVEEFEQAMSAASASTGEQIESTADIGEQVRQGMVIRRKLNVVVRNRYKNDPGKLAAWESAYHIEHPKKKKKNENPPNP